MNPALQIIIVGIGTYVIRISAIALSGHLGTPSESTEATLRLIGPAVLAATIADRLFLVHGDPTLKWDWWIAAVVALAASWRWKSAGVTVAAGMSVVWLIAALT
jgi:branched-subunit amino acid transport protein